ncbi:programmed cell death protein 7 [Leptonychotes weddellii]|uniref:Programmed cell death protein 7 n=1 Tax=Leptonychotes weddellii TaxID=9713 RepID=A0A7F8QA75_LEPWE|nr:programmed cell death protein 7 [Leptonychotes weddellii]
MALPPFFAPGRPGPPPPQPPPPAPFGCPPPPLPSPAFPPPLPQRLGEVRARLRGALRLVRRLRDLGQALREAEADGAAWVLLHAQAAPLRAQLAERLQLLTQAAYVGEARRRLERVRRRRLRLRERAREREAEREAEAARAAEREQEIDLWRVKCVQEVEEKKREQELKAAADGVLSEVRKKQADTKRMVDILRALEKLRKLRKEAAARKGNHGFAFLLVFIPLLPCSFPFFTLAPPKFLKEKCLIIFFSPNRVIKLVSSTTELLKQKPQTLFTPLLTRLKREAGVGTHYAAFPLIHHSHPRHSWPRFSE